MIIIDWLCNQRRTLDFKLYPVSENIYVDDNFDLYKYIEYYDTLVDLHCNDIDSALFIGDNFTTNIWHVVARMSYMDWEDLRIKDKDFFFNSLKQLHIRLEYVSTNNAEEKWIMFEFKGKFYGEFEQFDAKKRSTLIYLGDEYKMSKLAYEEYLALKEVKWKYEWNY